MFDQNYQTGKTFDCPPEDIKLAGPASQAPKNNEHRTQRIYRHNGSKIGREQAERIRRYGVEQVLRQGMGRSRRTFVS